MTGTASAWEGDDWERHCLLLLRLRYRPPSAEQFQRVPAEDRGDCGIEGFSTDGVTYQCYAPDHSVAIPERYKRQRDKLTRDVGTMIEKQDEIKAILGTTVISRYVFMVPVHDSKELNKHAKAQQKRLRDAKLSFLAPDVEVLVVTEDDYPVEVATLLHEGLQQMNLNPIPPSDSAIDGFLSTKPELIETMRGKLAKVPEYSSPDRLEAALRALITAYIRGENALVELYEQHPAGFELLEEVRTSKEGSLTAECLLATDSPLDLVNRIRRDYADRLGDELGFLRSADIEFISFATVAEWLMECPLDFHNV